MLLLHAVRRLCAATAAVNAVYHACLPKDDLLHKEGRSVMRSDTSAGV